MSNSGYVRHRGGPESKQELEERTRRMREPQLQTSVTYSISAVVEHGGISAMLRASRGAPCVATVTVPNVQVFNLSESQIEPLLAFLKFLKHECDALRDAYGQIDDTPGPSS